MARRDGDPLGGYGLAQRLWSTRDACSTTRVFHAIANPKVTRETFSEKGSAELDRRLANTTHIEGFPTLRLMHLHNVLLVGDCPKLAEVADRKSVV